MRKTAREATRRQEQARSLFEDRSHAQTTSQQAKNTAKKRTERAKVFIAPEEAVALDIKEKGKKGRKGRDRHKSQVRIKSRFCSIT